MRLAPGARRYALALALLALPATIVFAPAGLALGGLAAGVRWFYRDPERTAPESGVVSPADGRVSVVREEDGRVRVGVFMSPADVHVNRAPLSGTVTDVEHVPGGHWPAFSKESERNERVHVTVDGDDGTEWRVTQIAGSFARRITPYAEPGDELERADRIGHIAFGSRADVLLPAGYEPSDVVVEVGDRVRAGESVVATRSADP